MAFSGLCKRWTALLLVTMLLCLIFMPAAKASSSTGTVTASSLNMRKKASSDAKILTVLSKGATVTIQGSSGSWYKVTYGKYTGYVSAKYIKKGNGSTSSSSSASSSSSSSSALKAGCSGSKVKEMQKKLKKLGYYSGNADGDFGSGTEAAVKKFQKAKGLKADGVAGSQTLQAIDKALNGNSSSSGSDSDSGSGSTERLNWFKGGSNKIPKGATFQVKDCTTGKVFTCKRWSGYNHLDAEPKTASDTKILKSIFGHWTWRRRPVLVKYNGHVYAASMNGMPHGTSTIKGNNFDGHFCIHFSGSKTHGSGKVDATHQECVKKAMNYSW